MHVSKPIELNDTVCKLRKKIIYEVRGSQERVQSVAK